MESRRINHMTRNYAGIGSRAATTAALRLITATAEVLARAGYHLRSGGALGADQAFRDGAGGAVTVLRPKDATDAAVELASKHHPRWDLCKSYVRLLHGRNAQIILGRDLDAPAEFVICWTDDEKRGGTALGLRIARAHGIRVVNLATLTGDESALVITELAEVESS